MRRAMIVVIVALMTAVVGGLPAQAATQQREGERTDRANLWFEQRDGHVTTDVYVDVATGKATEGSVPNLPFIYVYIVRWNMRTERLLFNGSLLTVAPDGALAIDHTLTWATLSTTLMIRDRVSHGRLPVSLDISWTRWGGVVTEHWTDVVRSPDGKIVMHGRGRMLSDGTYDAAIAIEGQLVQGRVTDSDSSVYRFSQRSVTVIDT